MTDTSKLFVMDTNIVLNDANVPFTMKDAHIILPQVVIRELDKKRDFTENKSAAYNARVFCRKLRKLIKEQKTNILGLSSGSTITLLPHNKEEVAKDIDHLGLMPNKADSSIIAVAWRLKQSGNNITLLTNDTHMWVTATSLNIEVEDYEVNRHFQDLYSGVKVIELEDSQLIEDVYNGVKTHLDEEDIPGLYPNQVLVLKSLASRHSSLLAVFKGYGLPLKRIPNKETMQFAGVYPLNKEQSFAFELLKDNKVPCVTLAGRAGTGKSMVALSYGIDHFDKGLEKIMVLKPIAPVGRDVGFLPGSLEEKLGPWMESFRDSLDVIFKCEEALHKKNKNTTFHHRTYEYLIDNGMLEFKPLTFMRGRSIQNTLIILDEAQNTSVHEMKTLLTRVGEGSKLIALGDVEQIDVPWLDQQNNGLTYLIERGKTSELLGHITFIKSHRSKIADWASGNL